jgi:osmotically-inducible protein OsmY
MATSTKKTAKKAAKRANKRASKVGGAAQERAAELAERAGYAAERAGGVTSERAAELAEMLRESEAFARAQERGTEIADLARAKWRQAEIEARASELADRVRDTDAAKQASRRAKDLSDTSLETVGAWLLGSRAADKLGVQRKSRIPAWMLALIGVAVGFAVAKLTADRSATGVRDDLAAAADRLAHSSSNPATTALADTIKTTLKADPRTAELSQVNINVAEGTVFVRGRVPTGIDEDAIREVIQGVPGVEDVDLHLVPA